MAYKCSKCGRESDQKETCCGVEMAEEAKEESVS